MSKVSDMAKMWEKKGQQDKQKADSIKVKITPAPSIKKTESDTISNPYQPSHEKPNYIANNQGLAPQRFTFQPQPSHKNPSQISQKEAFKSQLQQRLQMGGGSMMVGENVYGARQNKGQNHAQKRESSQVSNEVASYKNSRDQLQNFFKKKSQKSQGINQIEENPDESLQSDNKKIKLPQAQYVFGEFNDEGEEVEQIEAKRERTPENKVEEPAFLPKEEVVTKSQLIVRKPKNKPARSTHIGTFEDSD